MMKILSDKSLQLDASRISKAVAKLNVKRLTLEPITVHLQYHILHFVSVSIFSYSLLNVLVLFYIEICGFGY